ncbi:hypothetical protein BB559_000274 [Furculomyces boomerangus]|uniref:Protein YIP n=1 Tax=Furculomyces boomerangus TaxID=61424 RepID=A0A2T9Z5R6_9FUNG|nr:hypothetical protein BB559_000274 [Furculomyces boomerangus]
MSSVLPDYEDIGNSNSNGFISQSGPTPNLSGRMGTPFGASAGSSNYATVPGSLPGGYTINTLDETILQSINRDLSEVFQKTKQVLIPRAQKDVLKEWDLWGPLLFTLLLSILLSYIASEQQASIVFTEVFVVMTIGSSIVTLNCKLLGGNISFFQSVCTLGYCVSPLLISALITVLIKKNIISMLCVAATVFWSIYAASGFLTESHFQNRKLLALYPIVLFYSIFGWIITI